MLFKDTEDKANFYINHYANAILSAVQVDVNKVANATGNKESKESLKLQAQAALWIAVCENPEVSGKDLIEIARKMFFNWITDEYREEMRRNKKRSPSAISLHGGPRKSPTNSPSTLPWGQASQSLISPLDSPDMLIEKEDEVKHLVKTMDTLIKEWGPHAAVWAIAGLRSKGIFDAARNLGFTDEELKSAKVRNKLRKIYRVLADIRLELETNG